MGWSDPTSLPRKPWRSLQPSEQEKTLFTMCLPVSSEAKEEKKEKELMSIINKMAGDGETRIGVAGGNRLAVKKNVGFIRTDSDQLSF
jgi:hypothetical protein